LTAGRFDKQIFGLMKLRKGEQMRKGLIVLIVIMILTSSILAQESSGDKIGSTNDGQLEDVEGGEPDRALEGKIIFLSFGTFNVGFISDGKVVSWNLASLTATNRGIGKAVLAGLTAGLVGGVALPAIMAANANGLKPKELYDMLVFFPDGESFYFTSPLSNKSFKYD